MEDPIAYTGGWPTLGKHGAGEETYREQWVLGVCGGTLALQVVTRVPDVCAAEAASGMV